MKTLCRGINVKPGVILCLTVLLNCVDLYLGTPPSAQLMIGSNVRALFCNDLMEVKFYTEGQLVL